MTDRDIDTDLQKIVDEAKPRPGGPVKQFLDKRAIHKHDKMIEQMAQFLDAEPHPAVQERDRQRKEHETQMSRASGKKHERW